VFTVPCGLLCGLAAEWCELRVLTVMSDASYMWS
jgi:hypothetical protein